MPEHVDHDAGGVPNEEPTYTPWLDRRSWANRSQARRAVFEFVEVFYNRKHRHSSLSYLTPAEYETTRIYHAKAAQAPYQRARRTGSTPAPAISTRSWRGRWRGIDRLGAYARRAGLIASMRAWAQLHLVVRVDEPAIGGAGSLLMEIEEMGFYLGRHDDGPWAMAQGIRGDAGLIAGTVTGGWVEPLRATGCRCG